MYWFRFPWVLGITLFLSMALMVALAGEGLAQLRLLPASEFQRIAVRIPQAVSRNLEAMQQSNDFEFLAKFRTKNRYRRIARRGRFGRGVAEPQFQVLPGREPQFRDAVVPPGGVWPKKKIPIICRTTI